MSLTFTYDAHKPNPHIHGSPEVERAHAKALAMARRWAGRSRGRIDPEGLESTVNLVIAEAIPAYRAERGLTFEQFALYMVRHRLKDELRREDREQVAELLGATTLDLVDPAPGPEIVVVAASEQEEVREAVQRLPAPECRVILLRFWVDLSQMGTARVMGVTRECVRWRESQAGRSLCAMLQGSAAMC